MGHITHLRKQFISIPEKAYDYHNVDYKMKKKPIIYFMQI